MIHMAYSSKMGHRPSSLQRGLYGAVEIALALAVYPCEICLSMVHHAKGTLCRRALQSLITASVFVCTTNYLL